MAALVVFGSDPGLLPCFLFMKELRRKGVVTAETQKAALLQAASVLNTPDVVSGREQEAQFLSPMRSRLSPPKLENQHLTIFRPTIG